MSASSIFIEALSNDPKALTSQVMRQAFPLFEHIHYVKCSFSGYYESHNNIPHATIYIDFIMNSPIPNRKGLLSLPIDPIEACGYDQFVLDDDELARVFQLYQMAIM